MRKNLLTPEQIEAGNFSPKTKRTYLYRWNRSVRMKSIIQQARELREKLKQNAHLPIQELADLLGITKKSVSTIACKHRIILYGNGRPKAIATAESLLSKRIKKDEKARKVQNKRQRVRSKKAAKEEKEKAKLESKALAIKKASTDKEYGKSKIIQPRAAKVAKTKEKRLESKVRNYEGSELIPLGYMRLMFYVPKNATPEEVEELRKKKLEKYKKTA